MFKLKKNSSEEKIKKSKEIIKEEKRKIKEEKKKIKSHTKKKPKKHIEKEIYTSKEVAISIVISMILGAVICISAVLLTLKLNHVLDSYKDLSKLIETYKTITNNGVIPCIKPEKIVIDDKEYKNLLIGNIKNRFQLENADCILPNCLKEDLC